MAYDDTDRDLEERKVAAQEEIAKSAQANTAVKKDDDFMMI